ncbi:MAG: hypothetical protein ACREH8_08085 [Opitutaceae bacterium]
MLRLGDGVSDTTIVRGKLRVYNPMNSYRKWIGAIITGCVVTAIAFAAEAAPTGLWKWTVQGRQGQGFEQTVKLEYKDGKLSGIMPGRDAGRFSVPDTPISDASFKDGEIKFAVTRELNGQKFTTTYQGKLAGDTITGTFERGGANTKGPNKSEWIARRG